MQYESVLRSSVAAHAGRNILHRMLHHVQSNRRRVGALVSLRLVKACRNCQRTSKPDRASPVLIDSQLYSNSPIHYRFIMPSVTPLLETTNTNNIKHFASVLFA